MRMDGPRPSDSTWTGSSSVTPSDQCTGRRRGRRPRLAPPPDRPPRPPAPRRGPKALRHHAGLRRHRDARPGAGRVQARPGRRPAPPCIGRARPATARAPSPATRRSGSRAGGWPASEAPPGTPDAGRRIERRHPTLEDGRRGDGPPDRLPILPVLLEHHRRPDALAGRRDHARPRKGLRSLAPADVRHGRGEAATAERARIGRRTPAARRPTPPPDGPAPRSKAAARLKSPGGGQLRAACACASQRGVHRGCSGAGSGSDGSRGGARPPGSSCSPSHDGDQRPIERACSPSISAWRASCAGGGCCASVKPRKGSSTSVRLPERASRIASPQNGTTASA